MKNEKARMLVLLELLWKQSDPEYPVSMAEILTSLEQENIMADRRSIYRDIKQLQQHGFEIEFVKTPRQGYVLENRLFELAEAQVLLDAVAASSFLSVKKKNQLIHKILSTQSEIDQKNLITTPTSSHQANEHLYYTIDALQQAIKKTCSISFRYFDMTIDKKRKYRKQASLYHLDPYAIVWENQRYYCIGYHQKYQSFSNYRIDKMEQVTLLDSYPQVPFDLADYRQKNFAMVAGSAQTVILQFDLSLVSSVFDEFGQDVMILNHDESTFTISFSTTLSIALMASLIKFKNQVKIIAPQELQDRFISLLSDILKLYQ